MSASLAKTHSAGLNMLLVAARQELGWFHQFTHSTVSGEPYIAADHLRALAYALDRLADGEIRRLLIAVPPRHFKSSVASVAMPAYLLGRDPSLKVVCASYGLDLAREFAHLSLQMMQSPRYAQVFPHTRLAAKKPALDLLRTTKNGYRIATSVDGPLTGKGADVIIVDDPMKAPDAYSPVERDRVWQWFTTSLMTRFDKPSEGRVAVVMQRLHQNDLIGRLRADSSWEVIEFPAETVTQYMMYPGADFGRLMTPGELLFPERFNAEVLARLRHELGELGYNAQMLQRPVPAGGALFKLGKAQRFELPPASLWKKKYERVLLSIDPAGSTSQIADYSALTWWGFTGGQVHLLNAVRGQWDLPVLLPKVRKWRAGVSGILVESCGVGLSLHSMLRADDVMNVWNWAPKKPKEARAAHANLLIDQGVMLFPISAPWLEELEAELSDFPQGKNDDYVDSVSQVAWNLQLLRTQLMLPHLSIGQVNWN